MLVALAALMTPVVHAADAEFGAPAHESRTMLYFTVPVGIRAHQSGPAVGLRLDRADTSAYSGWGATVIERQSVPLMDLRLSMGREPDIRLNRIPMWTQGRVYNAVDDSGSGTKPSRPFWKRPAFWIVTGTVVTVAFVGAQFADGYHRINNSTAPQGAAPH
jgi:hypothetical protein